MTDDTIWRIRELLGSGYSAHDVAKILNVPFHYVIWVETTPNSWLEEM